MMGIFYKLFVKRAACATQQKTQGETNASKAQQSDNVAATKQANSGGDGDSLTKSKERSSFLFTVFFATAIGCFVSPFTKTYRLRIVEYRTQCTLSFYLVGIVFYVQSLYSYYGIKHPPIQLLYSNPAEYNKMDNENIKLLYNSLKHSVTSLYQRPAKESENQKGSTKEAENQKGQSKESKNQKGQSEQTKSGNQK